MSLICIDLEVHNPDMHTWKLGRETREKNEEGKGRRREGKKNKKRERRR